MEQQEVKGDAITPESNPIAYTLSVTTPDEVVAVVNNPEIKPHARPDVRADAQRVLRGFMVAAKPPRRADWPVSAVLPPSTWTPTSSVVSVGRSTRSSPSRVSRRLMDVTAVVSARWLLRSDSSSCSHQLLLRILS